MVMDTFLWLVCASAAQGMLLLVGMGSTFPNFSVVFIPYIVAMLSVWFVGGYDRDTDFASLRFASELVIAGILATFLGSGLAALFGSYGSGVQTSRFFLFATPFFFTFAALFLRRYRWGLTGGGFTDMRIIVVGTLDEASRLEQGLRLTGRPTPVMQLSSQDAVDGDLESLLRAPQLSDHSKNARDTIVIAPSAAAAMKPLSPFLVSLHSSSVPVYNWTSFWGRRIKSLDWGNDSAEWFFDNDFRLTYSAFSGIKRFVDIFVALVGLVLSSPLLLITTLLIRMDSPGPAIFRQLRTGLRGREFTIFKFRTMRLNSELAGKTTDKEDVRVTRLGNFLRKYRIDEIPQLLNVLKGEMSIVGPRPEWTVCVAEYEDKLPGYHLRHLAKPGITGWAQVNYPYGEGVEDARNKLSFDLFYVAHPSIILDCSIILKTVHVMVGKIGGR